MLLQMALFHPFKRLSDTPSSVYHISFVHSSVNAQKLLPCLGSCKQCCVEHWGAYILLKHGFLRYIPGVGLLYQMVVLFLVFKGTSILFSTAATAICIPINSVDFPGGSAVKNLPAVWETWVERIPWRRERLPIPVDLPREFHGERSLAGYSPWGWKESDTTKRLQLSLSFTNSVGGFPLLHTLPSIYWF